MSISVAHRPVSWATGFTPPIAAVSHRATTVAVVMLAAVTAIVVSIALWTIDVRGGPANCPVVGTVSNSLARPDPQAPHRLDVADATRLPAYCG